MDLRCGTRLAGVDGLDAERGLAHTGGRVDLYGRLLARFAAHYVDGVPGLIDPESPPDVIARHAHSVRGACAAIGARALEAQALDLESACRLGQDAKDVAPRAAVLQAGLVQLARALAEAAADR